MSIKFGPEITGYLQGFNEFKKSDGIDKHPSYVKLLREDAMNDFCRLGFPTLLDEDWKFTNLAPISRSEFTLYDKPGGSVTSKRIEKLSFKPMDSHRLVFVNGKFAEDISDLKGVRNKVIISSLSEAFLNGDGIVSDHFGKLLTTRTEAFNALNTALFQDGTFVYVPSRTVLDVPIHSIYISTGNEQAIVNPRNLIVIGDSCELKVIEHYVSLSEAAYFSNVVSEIFVGENSVLEHYMLEFESRLSYNVSTLRVEQQRSSNLNSHSVLFGGAIVRNNVHPVLNGQGCNSLINGLYMSNGRQQMDNFMKVEHKSPNCDSRQFYNGVLDDRSRGVFHGRIIVHEGAEKTDAKQSNKNLLLSDTAQIDTKPQLEIYNDDVKCTHGATIGQMDENAIFYLRSRGISQSEAQAIMLKGFTKENFANMEIDAIRTEMEKTASEWFDSRGSGNE